ncbi:AGCS family alanine or glycine:cation symporter [Litorivivens lipolytica]|uniref:AGCS family alanine or glycine:cation symporter n=1 Tax=Litorivivens lipolytica TaxID=1524264 RepID=A0A7W4Z5U9_9GAMM|nr:sodium:alanine symporter family protein [Litorivivens lipolytica]MBB3046280.1 AGCS family alanine or glycine:cation symporter [Litorivivens lipolytica]
MLQTLEGLVATINGWVWGVPMLALILGTGLYLMLGLRFMPLRNIGRGFRMLFDKKDTDSDGNISSFQALMTSLSATIGTGNIAGVATAIALGGPGALFWMWCTALVGMATKYAEAVCAVHYRERDANGNFSGGPMYYIKNGLSENWRWLAVAFALFGAVAGFGIGNGVQANSVADALDSSFGIDARITGICLFIAVAAVVLGGVKRIAEVAGVLVPLMAALYLLAGLIIVISSLGELPGVIALVFESAFTGTAATGGFAGAAVWAAIRFGVARGIFSNEAGLGSAPIAHAAAKTDSAVGQGMIAMLGTFIDTLIVCSITGFVILLSGAWTSGENGAALSAMAFDQLLPGGEYVVSIGLVLFAFTTILGWSYYCERCVVYLFGVKAELPFRILWVSAVPFGALANLEMIWLVADTLNAMMALPNLVALLLLSPVVFRLTREYRAAR